MKLIIVDLDGTLFNTNEVNYLSYREALKQFGYTIDYDFFCKYCNGRSYQEFLPEILGGASELADVVHEEKKKLYCQYLDMAKPNNALLDIVNLLRVEYKAVIVTTASEKNSREILTRFGAWDLFDAVISRECYSKAKPDPEGFYKAMKMYDAAPEETVIFEDSEVGLMAAEQTGATVFAAMGYNGAKYQLKRS